ncbi:uncharacterized protein J3R85_009561 [Psidium guajava]|nr:uncharacterized protein J3R85_009561 [Psidium guajava]
MEHLSLKESVPCQIMVDVRRALLASTCGGAAAAAAMVLLFLLLKLMCNPIAQLHTTISAPQSNARHNFPRPSLVQIRTTAHHKFCHVSKTDEAVNGELKGFESSRNKRLRDEIGQRGHPRGSKIALVSQ